jgi:Protein of unknown function (DUF1425)
MNTAKYLLAVLPLIALAGCVPAPIEGRADTYTPAQLNFTSRDLRSDTAIGKIQLRKDESGILHVDVPVRNTTIIPIEADYRISFVDQNGMLIEGPNGWTNVTLPPNVWQDIQVNSASPRATDFHMDLRPAQ